MANNRKIDGEQLKLRLEATIARVIDADKKDITMLDGQGLAVHVLWVCQALEAAPLTWNDLEADCAYDEFRETGRRRLLADCNNMLDTYEGFDIDGRAFNKKEYLMSMYDKIVMAKSFGIPASDIQAIVVRARNLQLVS